MNRFAQAADVANQIPADKFHVLLTRVLQKLHFKVSDKNSRSTLKDNWIVCCVDRGRSFSATKRKNNCAQCSPCRQTIYNCYWTLCATVLSRQHLPAQAQRLSLRLFKAEDSTRLTERYADNDVKLQTNEPTKQNNMNFNFLSVDRSSMGKRSRGICRQAERTSKFPLSCR